MRCAHCERTLPVWTANRLRWDLGFRCSVCRGLSYVREKDMKGPASWALGGFMLIVVGLVVAIYVWLDLKPSVVTYLVVLIGFVALLLPASMLALRSKSTVPTLPDWEFRVRKWRSAGCYALLVASFLTALARGFESTAGASDILLAIVGLIAVAAFIESACVEPTEQQPAAEE